MKDVRTSVNESYVLILVDQGQPKFVTVTGEGTPYAHLAERFSSEREAKKIKRAFERVPWDENEYTVARLIEVHTYSLSWEEPKP